MSPSPDLTNIPKDCFKINNFFEIITIKEDFYKIKTSFEKKVDSFLYFGIEWRALNYLNLDKESFYKRLHKMFRAESVDAITRNYLPRTSSTDQYKKALSNIMTDWTFGIHALELLELHQDNAYGYLFNEPSPVLDGKLGAYHASELPYVFGSATKEIIKDFCSKEAQKISNFFQVSWTQFAKTGSPSSDLMRWDKYDINQSIAFINSTPKIKTIPNKERIKLLNESKAKF